MALTAMRLVDWLDDLCVRFIINLPVEELSSVERILFQIEEAQWFYEDFIRPLDPTLPSMNLRFFCLAMLRHCPLTAPFPEAHESAYQNWLAYKTSVPVRGAIMLNQDMSKVVLVKGWKSNAKWSFPRGKINKGEKDLTCAIREVWEETGLDLSTIPNMVPKEGEEDRLKKISVSMREQDMVLYVFRGVPEDTHFEPRTRKEISKIDWYSITDLPTIKRKHQKQQGDHETRESNNFYMVAPFLGPLRKWIHLEHKRERQLDKAAGKSTRRILSGVTDTEDIDAGDTTTDDAPPPEMQQAEERSPPQNDDHLANLLANLGRGHRTSDALPEVSLHEGPPQVDPAAELKRLLSVGGEQPSQPPPVEAPAPAQHPQHNGHMAMLQASNRPPPPLQDTFLYRSAPAEASNFAQHSQNPRHHQHPANVSHMHPPMPFHHQQRPLPFRGPYPNEMQQQHPQAMSMPVAQHFLPPPHQQAPTFSAHAPSIHPSYAPDHNPRPYQRTGDPQFAPTPDFQGAHGPVIPPESQVPLPKLTPHALGLLNAFKGPGKSASASGPPSQPTSTSYTTPRGPPPAALHREVESFASPSAVPSAVSSAHPYAPSPPTFQSPPPNGDIQPVQQPKPRSAHQDSLLKLFRPPSVSATPPPSKDAQPVELSAYPRTPGQPALQHPAHQHVPPMPDISRKPHMVQTGGMSAQKPDLTSATVSGPVNVPDFETVKRHKHDGHSRGPSPMHARHIEQQKPFAPQILKRDPGLSRPISQSPVEVDATRSLSSASSSAPPPAQQHMPPPPPPQMRILKRPQQGQAAAAPTTPTTATAAVVAAALSPVPLPTRPVIPTEDKRALVPQDGPVHLPSVPPLPPSGAIPAPIPAGFDRRDTAGTEQKNTLLSLFGKAGAGHGAPAHQLSKSPASMTAAAAPAAPAPSALSKSPLPPNPKSPQPPTPRSVVSGIISPVSPLPAADRSSQVGSPAHLGARSRISSIGEGVGMPPLAAGAGGSVPPVASASASVAGAAGMRNGHGHGHGLAGGVEDVLAGGLGNGNGIGNGKGVGRGKEKEKERAPSASASPVDANFLRGFLESVAKKGR